MREKHEHGNSSCTTCNRPVGCPECKRPWPDGVPGYLDETLGWRNGARPLPARQRDTDAEKALQRAQHDYDEAHACWNAAAVAHAAAQGRMRSGPTVTFGGQMQTLTPAGSVAEVKRLARIAADAAEKRDAAGRKLVDARQAAARREASA